jgi:4-amino-4-deoxy-L-arabinose transferase-like glycosyltransferase
MIVSRALAVFLLALLFRGVVYLLILGSPQVVQQPDSVIYLSVAENLMQHGTYYPTEGRTSPFMVRTPVYPVFVALVLGVFGRNLLAVVLIQIFLDSMTCVMVCWLAEKIQRGTGLLSGLLAAVNLGMVTYSHFILNDSVFVFGFVWVLLSLWYVLDRGSWRSSACLGVSTGCAVLIRPVAEYLGLFLTPLLLWAFMVKHRQSLLRAVGNVAVVIGAFVFFVLPWMGYNKLYLGEFRLTAQSGEHLLQYVVPFRVATFERDSFQ